MNEQYTPTTQEVREGYPMQARYLRGDLRGGVPMTEKAEKENRPMSECCASGSCEVCRRPSGYSREERDRISQERDTYDPPWVREHEREGWHR